MVGPVPNVVEYRGESRTSHLDAGGDRHHYRIPSDLIPTQDRTRKGCHSYRHWGG